MCAFGLSKRSSLDVVRRGYVVLEGLWVGSVAVRLCFMKPVVWPLLGLAAPGVSRVPL